LRKSQAGICCYCGQPYEGAGEEEHMTPVSKGGTGWIWNLSISCGDCNRGLGGKHRNFLTEWLYAEDGRLETWLDVRYYPSIGTIGEPGYLPGI
jgi:5-methylcytosine-specific restriction endonuclease McrA